MSRRSREQVRDPIKRGDPEFLQIVTRRLPQLLPTELVARFLAPDVVLVPTPRRITVVDDFVTKGATLLAAASRVQEAFPEAEVRAFALVRTKGLVADIESIGEPCEGLITRVGDHVDRHP